MFKCLVLQKISLQSLFAGFYNDKTCKYVLEINCSKDNFEFLFFPDEMPSFAGSGGPLRQKALWDLTLTCRTLTSYWVRSLARTWGSKSHGRSKSSGGFIWSDPRAGFFQKGGDGQINPKRLRPKPGTHLVFQAQLCWARFGLESYPS